jgi:hypothetical protein
MPQLGHARRDSLLTGRIDDKYHKQMQFQLACSGRAWCDFVSFDPRFPEPMRLWVKRGRARRCGDQGNRGSAEVFLAEVDETVARLREKVADSFCLPCCSKHHRRQHDRGWITFLREMAVTKDDCLYSSDKLWREWPARYKWEMDRG